MSGVYTPNIQVVERVIKSTLDTRYVGTPKKYTTNPNIVPTGSKEPNIQVEILPKQIPDPNPDTKLLPYAWPPYKTT